MSHLARDLDRHVVWIEKQAKELTDAVEGLIAFVKVLMSGADGWEPDQCDVIRQAINNWADQCGRSILHAQLEVDEFRKQLMDAIERR